jgi:ABC transporter substrate binding protein
VTDRRRFIVTAVGFLAAPLAAEAQQQTGKVYRIGYLYRGSKSDAVAIPGYLPAFLEGLRRLGCVEGKNRTFEVWAAEGHSENLPTLAADLVRTKPDVIVVHGAGDAVIVQKLTKTVPIVTLSAGDLAASGVVASVANPGGNVTGMQVYSSELMAKRLEILKAFPVFVGLPCCEPPSSGVSQNSPDGSRRPTILRRRLGSRHAISDLMIQINYLACSMRWRKSTMKRCWCGATPSSIAISNRF